MKGIKMHIVALLAPTVIAATAFMNEGDPTERCDTVMIETENGPVRINAEDFDKKTMKLAGSQELSPPVTSEGSQGGNQQPSSQPQRLVSSEGKGDKQRFFIVDAAGARLTGEGIAEDGYATDAEAWAAITALIDSEQKSA
jgi:hypothetical protein